MISDAMRKEVTEIAARARSQGWEIAQESKWLFDQKKKLVEYQIVFKKQGEERVLKKTLRWDLSSLPRDKEDEKKSTPPSPSSDQSF